MSDIKDLNNEELKEVVGGAGDGVTNHKFDKNDWISKERYDDTPYISVYYIVDVVDNHYHLIKYTAGNDSVSQNCNYTKEDLGNKPCISFETYYYKINKPFWITDDVSL